MDNPEQYKTFLKAYQKINESNKELYPYFEDKRLTHAEKKILQSLIKLMQGHAQEAIELLDSVTIQSKFLLAYQLFLKGIALNHMSLFDQASKELVKSIEILSHYEDTQFVHKPISVISKVYFNLKDLKRLKKYYEVYKTINQGTDGQIILDYEYQIFISLLEEKSEEALNLLDELLFKYKKYLKRSLRTYIVLKIMAFVQLKDFDQCFELLEDYKNTPGFKVKENYIFILSFLNFLTKNASLYIYDRDFSENKYLFYQLKVIQNLFLQNKEEAIKYWTNLQKSAPELYQDQFEYRGGTDLFGLALKKTLIEQEKESFEINLQDLEKLKSTSAKLEYILENYPDYVTKDKLIELIWGEEWSPQNDGRLRTLISRVKKKKSYQIDIRDGKYKKVA